MIRTVCSALGLWLTLPWMLSFWLAACAGEGRHSISLVFPDEESRDLTARVHLWALDAAGADCDELLAGTVLPDDLDVLADVVLRYPGGAEAGRLGQVPSGGALFFAEGLTEDGAQILLGCAPAEVRSGGDLAVVIELQWSCHPDPAGEIPLNGLDDDCDGATDECLLDEDCEDGSACTADLCVTYECHNRALPDDLACNDGDPCTTDDACLAGVCQGQERDCSSLDGPCLVGWCDPATVECRADPRPEGTSCDDSRPCTELDACHAGVCEGLLVSCDDGDSCTRDSCEEATGECQSTLVGHPGAEGPLGDPTCSNGLDDDCDRLTDGQDPNCTTCASGADCDDGNACTADDCDLGTGSCLNLDLPDGSDCDDALFCTTGDGCQAGVCRGGPRDCSAQSGPCQAGVCLETEARCASQPKTDGTTCSDGLFCRVGDRCLAGACLAVGDRDCDDSDFCTVDTCDEELDRCDHLPDPNPAQEGPPGDDTCFNGQDDDCDGKTDLDDQSCGDCTDDGDCDDGNPCTLDSCVTNQCQTTTAQPGTFCDDGDSCTMNDGCDGQACRGVPLDLDGDGFVSGACGGLDCDDSQASVNPNAQEGPFGEATCGNGRDDDCDGTSDAAEPACWEPMCSADGFCWENPLPQGDGLMGVFGFSATDVWFVGFDGAILHWDGVALRAFDSGTSLTLYDLWGAAPNDIWAVGAEGTLLHFTGSGWSSVSSGTGNWLYGIHGFSATDIWAVGAGGFVLRRSGTSWSSGSAGTGERLLDVDGPNADDLYAVGWAGVIRHRYGGSWHTETSGTTEMLAAVAASAEGGVWAAGGNGALLQRVSGAWQPASSNTTNELYGLKVFGATDRWAAGESVLLHDTGSGWTLQGLPAGLGIFSIRAGDLQRFWAAAADDLWLVGAGGLVVRRQAGSWREVSRPSVRVDLNALWMNDSEAWAVGDAGALLRWDAIRRVWVRESSPVSGTLWGVCGPAVSSGTPEMWAVGEGGLALHRDPSTGVWSAVDTGSLSGLRDVECPNPGEAFAVGEDGVALRWNGSAWSAEITNTTSRLRALSIAPSGQMAAVGDDGTILMRSSAAAPWQVSTSGTTSRLNDVWRWGLQALAVGQDGTVRYFDGSSWVGVASGVTAESLYAVWHDGITGESLMGGNNGVLYYWDASAWHAVDSGTVNDIADIRVTPAGLVRLVGQSGTILAR